MDTDVSRDYSRLVKFSPSKGELPLLMDLAGEMSNFFDKPNKASQLGRTFVLRPGSSEMFGIDVFDGTPTLGVPEVMFPRFMNTPWLTAVTVKGDGGLYLTFEIRGGEACIGAIRVFITEARASVLASAKILRLVSMRPDGSVAPLGPKSYFDLPMKQLSTLEWERMQPLSR